jgi:DNA-binding GntR family transcriptional regulator
VTQLGAPRQLATRAADAIRELIVRRELLPGEKIGQVELANRVGVSRSPLREALRTLESEGVVGYEPNRGYVVSRLDADDLAQIYRMRGLLETELLSTLVKPDETQVQQLVTLNEAMETGMAVGSVAEMLRANREFHFAIFALSPLDLFVRESRRLWQLSEGYRATYLWMPETRARVLNEHRQIIAALETFDPKRVAKLCAHHRGSSEDVVIGLLAK